jgi:hypothetical protein
MNVVIVLGCSKVLEGGNKKEYTPKSHAYGRLKKTIEIFNTIKEGQDENKIIICSGGHGQAEKMKSFLMINDIEENKILTEPYSRNTIENCIFTYELLNKWLSTSNLSQPILNIFLVTDDYHIKRSETIFRFFTNRLINLPNFPNEDHRLSIICSGSNFLSYIEDFSESEEKQIEHCYLNDALIITNYLNASLNQYQNWYPTVKDYSDRI